MSKHYLPLVRVNSTFQSIFYLRIYKMRGEFFKRKNSLVLKIMSADNYKHFNDHTHTHTHTHKERGDTKSTALVHLHLISIHLKLEEKNKFHNNHRHVFYSDELLRHHHFLHAIKHLFLRIIPSEK